MAEVVLIEELLHKKVWQQSQKDMEQAVDKLIDQLYGAIEALDKKDYSTYFGLMADTIDLTLAELVEKLEQEKLLEISTRQKNVRKRKEERGTF